LSLGFFSGVGPPQQAGSQKWFCEELVNEQLPAPSTHRESLWVRNELFYWWDCQFQLTPSFSKAVQCLAFSTVAVELPHPYTGFFSSSPPRWRGNIPSVYLVTSFVKKECNQLPSCARICGSLRYTVLHSPGGLADLLGFKEISSREVQSGGRQKFCVCLCLAGLVFPDACSCSLPVVLCVALLLTKL
jgi:hypothetical protein